MFYPIFKQELKHWSRKTSVYIFAAIFLALGILIGGATGGIFDHITVQTESTAKVNSPIYITGLFTGLSMMINFFIPAIIGVAVYRDYKSQMHQILYSYPFTKASYLTAKFLSAFTVTALIAICIGIGLEIGFHLPGVNPDKLGDFQIFSYLFTYFILVLPNILFVGILIFSLVTFSRKIAAGYILVLLLILVQGFINSFGSNPENEYYIGLFDPFGEGALNYITGKWTLAEQNTNFIPLDPVLLFNRLIWIGVSILIFIGTYTKFQFSENAWSLSLRKNKGKRVTKENTSQVKKIILPKVNLQFSFKKHLKTAWKIAKTDFKYIYSSWPFRIITAVGILFLFMEVVDAGEMYETNVFPTTGIILGTSAGVFGLFINILTFLYTGLLIHRSRVYKISEIENTTPVPNWVLMLSKFFAIFKMQLILLSIILLVGVSFQLYSGFYDIQLGHYLFELFVLKFMNILVWTFLAIFIHTLFKNPYLGFFILLLISTSINFLSYAGIEQAIYKYNQGGYYAYSDMNGYGDFLTRYFSFKSYWLFFGLFLLLLSSLFWVRVHFSSIKERFQLAKARKTKWHTILGISFLMIFLIIGSNIYYADNIFVERKSNKTQEKLMVEWEKKYKKYEGKAQPRIISAKVNMEIFPDERNFKAQAQFELVNKTTENIQELYLNHNGLKSQFSFDRATHLDLEDTVHHFDIYRLEEPLRPGEKIQLDIVVENQENHWLKKRSPVRKNGTFINSSQLFPSFGYSSSGELTDNGVRASYGLPKNDLRPHPSDSSALGNTYISYDSDWIDFEATVSTKEGQIAIAPGNLIKDWKKDGRHYFQYKMESKILNFFAFNSGDYNIYKDQWNDEVDIEIYYHSKHDYNLKDMAAGVKASLDYNSKNFSPYQHRVVRIVEFPRTGGSFAQSFPNTIPFSEAVGFIANNDTTDQVGVNYCFAITVHELAHQWWAHQVIGADVLGATMLSESLSEYVALQVLKHEHGPEKMRTFLKHSMQTYLRGRSRERKREKPLMYNDGQGYIRYQKGSLIFYALSDYLGEEKLNGALKKYVEKVQFQEPPYTTSIEMVNYIRPIVPDSLDYLIQDMFETITLYDNKIKEATVKDLENGEYEVTIEFLTRKYKDNEQGQHYYGSDSLSFIQKSGDTLLSENLRDYIELGLFSEEKQLYLKKHKITSINNKITLVVNEKPTEVGIDPYNKLIDIKTDDNRKKVD
ncbi:MAG: M1 family aminopeptidase [Flavobacteriales bacterium]|jgi:ABC-2 type transport system permease protein|nr:M1 family aminopeptidase [Flavobacteriales bacterium]